VLLLDRLERQALADRPAGGDPASGQELPDLGAAMARFDELLAEEPSGVRPRSSELELRRALGVA
jgi:hypothetical protein